jgi:hypothetical protein
VDKAHSHRQYVFSVTIRTVVINSLLVKDFIVRCVMIRSHQVRVLMISWGKEGGFSKIQKEELVKQIDPKIREDRFADEILGAFLLVKPLFHALSD